MTGDGPCSTDQTERFLREVRIPIGVAVNGSSGHPYLRDAQSNAVRSLLARVEDETSIGIEPKARVSWDFRDRMKWAV
jgi:hypothetical protein